MFYDQDIGIETISREYKELIFNHHYDNKEAEKLIKSSKWVYNDLIIKDIKQYLLKYLPKYTGGFMDTLSETLVGELYEKYKSNDGYLVIILTKENTFG